MSKPNFIFTHTHIYKNDRAWVLIFIHWFLWDGWEKGSHKKDDEEKKISEKEENEEIKGHEGRQWRKKI